MTPSASYINPQRLLADLRQLATFGQVGSGVCRVALSQPDLEARRWLVQRLTEAGLQAQIDGVGNVIGRSPQPGPALLIGSHTDSQPRGGWLDGALGVIYGLEIARAFRESDDTRRFAVDVVSFEDEEGTLFGCLGSHAFCGKITPAEIDEATSRHGRPLRDEIAAAGLSDIPLARLDHQRQAAYLEAHIEQGRILEVADNRIGVVTRIVGIRQFQIRFVGQSNHAGTTPMSARKDAGVALIDFAYRLREAFTTLAGPKTVWTIGQVTFDPGAASIIPGAAEMTLQFRDPEIDVLDRLQRHLNQLLALVNDAGIVHLSMSPRTPVPPSIMNADLQQHLGAAAETLAAGAWVQMPSAAGHDAMVLADQLPCAMLFVPSIGGVSHDFAEDTHEADIVLGCQVLATAAASILKSWSL